MSDNVTKVKPAAGVIPQHDAMEYSELPVNLDDVRLYRLKCLRQEMLRDDAAVQCWPIPEEFLSNRYSVSMHGVGLADEYPSIKHAVDVAGKAYDGVIEAGMTLCVESFIGSYGGREGVKLEEQVIVTEAGIERMSTYPFELDWL